MPESPTTAAQDSSLLAALAEAAARHDAGRGKCVCELCTILAAHPTPATAAVTVDSVKMLRETMCVAQAAILHREAFDTAIPHVDRIQEVIGQLDAHRPLGPDGAHDGLHTATCGCEDVTPGAPAPVSDTRREDVALDRMASRFVTESLHAQVSVALMREFAKREPESSIAQHPDSYIATFNDMATAVLAALPATPSREDVARVRARAIRTADIWDASGDPVIEAWHGEQFTTADLRALAALPAPPVVDEAQRNVSPETGHAWPCRGFYVLSSEKDRTDDCTCCAPAPPVVDEARLARIREQVRDVEAGPRGRKCPSCGSAPGDACYGNGPMPKVHGQRLPKECASEDVAFLLDLVEQRGATRG